MHQPLVSVIITTYRRGIKYVEEAVNSVQHQTYSNIEIIVVDDNGDEKGYSRNVQEMCKSNDIVYIKNLVNRGAQYSRNIGILQARGEYIAFLDDDDLWVDEKIQEQMVYFTDPEVGMVYCDGYSFEDGNISNRWEFREASIYHKPIDLRMELFNDFIGSTSQALIKKECFAQVGMFDTELLARQDYEMWLRICKYYKVVGSPKKLLLYRSHAGKRISTDWEKCINSYRLILKKHKMDYARNLYAKAKIKLRIVDYSIKAKKYLTAISYLVSALCTSPLCVMDVVNRRIRKCSFNDYYKERIERL